VQVLYVVDLDIACDASPDSADAYPILLELLHGWISREATGAPDLRDFDNDGQRTYKKRGYNGDLESIREATWRVAGDSQTRALRVDVRQVLNTEDAWFLTRVTISHDTTTARFRMVMGRDIPSGWMSPVPVEQLRRPALIPSVVRNPRLSARVLKQSVDNKYIAFGSQPELTLLLDVLSNTTRLPILVVHPIKEAGHAFTRKAADELQGLARVASLSNISTWKSFNESMQDSPTPFGGARLYWPDLRAQKPDFSRVALEEHGPQEITHQLLRILAPVSVVARGRDFGWEIATAAERAAASRLVDSQLSTARARGDQAEENQVLSARVTQLEQDLEAWVQYNEELTEENAKLEALSQEMSQYKYQAEAWRQQYLDAVKRSSDTGRAELESAPECDASSITELLDFIEGWTNNSCAFTANAAHQWRKSNYPNPSKMRSTLLALAQAADQFAIDRGSISVRMDDWFRETFDLKVAMSDRKLSILKLDKFTFEGREWDRTSHVKLDDHTSPNQVGRIYFAIDHESGRFIIDHIGLKLHSL
jgi:hypothetical protein